MRLLSVGLVLLAACGDGSGPSDNVPALGSYAYTYHSARPGGGADLEFAGWLVVTYATEDSIAGHWDVPGFQSEISGGTVNASRYIVDALTDPSVGLVINRLTVGGPGLPVESCSIAFVDGGGNLDSITGTCTLTKQ